MRGEFSTWFLALRKYTGNGISLGTWKTPTPGLSKELSSLYLNLSSVLCQDILIKRGKPRTFVKNHNIIRTARACNTSKDALIISSDHHSCV